MNDMFEKTSSGAEVPKSMSDESLDQLEFKIETLYGVELEDLDQSEAELRAEFDAARESFNDHLQRNAPTPPKNSHATAGSPNGPKGFCFKQRRLSQSGNHQSRCRSLGPLDPPAAPSLPYDDDLSDNDGLFVMGSIWPLHFR